MIRPPYTDVVRLSVNLAPSVANALSAYATEHGVSMTETIRRAALALHEQHVAEILTHASGEDS